MNRFCQLLEKYDRLVIFDTETTGLQWSRDEIIEFAAVTVEAGENSESEVPLVTPFFTAHSTASA